ncbi:MAG: hypothetical protein J6D53_10530 [Blautia sp.]|nr:hypothetical protein [Blautia sp.]
MKSGRFPLRMLILAVALICIPAGGCGKQESTDDAGNTQSSLGVDNQIAGFPFNFDKSAETAKMVKDKDKGIFPESVTWAYAENLKVHEKAPTMTSEDPDFIRDIYYALSNTIVMGNAFERSTETPYFIEITLNNGGTIRYNFVSPSVIRLSEQNYVIESDGSLWRTLREASKKYEKG